MIALARIPDPEPFFTDSETQKEDVYICDKQRSFFTGAGCSLFCVTGNLEKQLINKNIGPEILFIDLLFYAFCPGTITTHAESINSDLQRGQDRRLRHTTSNTEENQ